MSRSEPTANDYALAWLRMAIGFLFLIFAEYKLIGSTFVDGGGFESWIHRFLHGGAYPFMAPFLTDFVLPHARLFALIVTYGELSIGLALVLGILVRPASFFGFLYMMVLLFSSNYPGAHAPIWEYCGAALNHLVPALCFVTFGMSNAARVWSAPAFLRKKHRRHGTGDGEFEVYPHASSNVFGK